MTTLDHKNRLYFGDNLDILREHVADESVDLIYLDPPFNSNATYNVLFRERTGEESAAQITAFDDTWRWNLESELAYRDVVANAPERLGRLIASMREFLRRNDMMAYLTMMAQRMVELHRVLKPTGSIYLHCDPTASHYLKLLLDAVFGADNFRTEIVWQRTSAHPSAQRWASTYDCILFYTKSNRYTWNPAYQAPNENYVRTHYIYEDAEGIYRAADLTGPGISSGSSGETWKGFNPSEKGRHWAYIPDTLDEMDRQGLIHWPSKRNGWPAKKVYWDDTKRGRPVHALWVDIPPINSQAKERLGYPTQKPEALLERIINASSNEGDVVLDPFCGCGTAIAVAERLKRRWIGIDITHLAISLLKSRLRDTFGPELSDYDVAGVPQDVESARALAVESEHDGRYQFEWWALGLVDARPARDRKKGADSGVDGYISFFDDNSGKPKRIIVQVKSGGVQRNQIATLIGDMEREKAEIALFITLTPPTGPMRQEALEAGFYTPESFPEHRFPRVQILTIEDLLSGAQAQYPRYAPPATFNRATRQRKRQGTQGRIV